MMMFIEPSPRLGKSPNQSAKKTLSKEEVGLNMLLDSFEAILIEAFVPRFNSRGGNLKGATYVDQFEGTPRFISEIENKSK